MTLNAEERARRVAVYRADLDEFVWDLRERTGWCGCGEFDWSWEEAVEWLRDVIAAEEPDADAE